MKYISIKETSEKWGISTTAKMEAAEAEARASKGRKKA